MFKPILILTSLALSATATAPSYFTITEVAAFDPYFLTDKVNGASIQIHITDPATKTSTTCTESWAPQATLYGPPDWMVCDDATFAFRFNSFVNYTDWTIGVRHQYKGAGKPCIKSSGAQCVTRLGYGGFNSSVPGYYYFDIVLAAIAAHASPIVEGIGSLTSNETGPSPISAITGPSAVPSHFIPIRLPYDMDITQQATVVKRDFEAVQKATIVNYAEMDESRVVIGSLKNLQLKMLPSPAYPQADGYNTYPSAMIATNWSDILYGSVRTVAKGDINSGGVYGFFFFANNAPHGETDIEIRTTEPDAFYINNQQDGSLQSGPDEWGIDTTDTGTDFSDYFHEYRLDWTPSGTTFYIDGIKVQTVTKYIPTGPGLEQLQQQPLWIVGMGQRPDHRGQHALHPINRYTLLLPLLLRDKFWLSDEIASGKQSFSAKYKIISPTDPEKIALKQCVTLNDSFLLDPAKPDPKRQRGEFAIANKVTTSVHLCNLEANENSNSKAPFYIGKNSFSSPGHRHVKKLARAAQIFFAEFALQQDQIKFSLAINNEAKIRRSTKSPVLGKAKVMVLMTLQEDSTVKKGAKHDTEFLVLDDPTVDVIFGWDTIQELQAVKIKGFYRTVKEKKKRSGGKSSPKDEC
ncbi:hypothetical protein MBLNU459_g0134t1 [Dothideomycetes sp. NU459]